MAITIDRVIQRQDNAGGVFGSAETLSQSTSTAAQEVSMKTDVSHLGVGTATGFGVNRYLLGTATAREGQEKVCLTTGTGEAILVLTGTATGALVFGADGDLAMLRYMNGTWFLLHNNGATFATATGTA